MSEAPPILCKSDMVIFMRGFFPITSFSGDVDRSQQLPYEEVERLFTQEMLHRDGLGSTVVAHGCPLKRSNENYANFVWNPWMTRVNPHGRLKISGSMGAQLFASNSDSVPSFAGVQSPFCANFPFLFFPKWSPQVAFVDLVSPIQLE